jgi:hypothetical protein
MRERPILMNGDMVRAILAGTKTQTRRPVKGIALEWLGEGMFLPEYVADEGNGLSPFGYPGDRLWVRETWASHPCGGKQIHARGDGHPWGSPIYRASFGAMLNPLCEGFTPWRPSIHMPRWACRLVLEIVSVRVERVFDITEEDALAEGFKTRAGFLAVFGQIYGLKGRTNPWVWVVEFKRTEVK